MLSISIEMRRRAVLTDRSNSNYKIPSAYASMRHQPGRRTPLVKTFGSGIGNGAMHVYVESFQIDAAHERVFPRTIGCKLLTVSLLLDGRC